MLADCGHEVKGFGDLRLVHVKWMAGPRHGVKSYTACPACYKRMRKDGELFETLEEVVNWIDLPYTPKLGECPRCKNNDFAEISAEDWQQEDNYAWREYTCYLCGFEWQEVYMLSHIEDSSANVLNNKGEVVIPRQIISDKGEAE